jgi:quercetin dioxygenase-like cupin family protein
MKIVRRGELPSRQLVEFGSVGVVTFVADGVVRMDLPPGGRIGMHPAVGEQLFVVVEGEGEVRSGSEAAHVSAGDAVIWAAGEEHETPTETGLVAIVVEPV